MNHSTTHLAPVPRSRDVLFRVALRFYGALAYLATIVGFFVLFAFLNDAWLPHTVDRGTSSPFAVAMAVDLALIALFGLQHSVMARPTFKRWWTTHIPGRIERSSYMVFSLIALGLLFWQWRPMPDVVWDLSGAAAVTAVGIQAFGWVVLFLSMFMLDHLELTGLRQTWLEGRGGADSLRTPFLYQLVRHPMMLGWLLVFWATPHMTLGHLLLAGAMTIYIFIGVHFEEQNLVESFGEPYRRYQRSVPKLLPTGRRPL